MSDDGNEKKDNKPDLSNLKARLGLHAGKVGAGPPSGLKRPMPGIGAEPPAGVGQPPAQAGASSPDAEQATRRATPGIGGHRSLGAPEPEPEQRAPRTGPPPGAAGPPPTARPKAREPKPAPAPLPVMDVEVDEDAGKASAFSPQFIALLCGILILGVTFGYMFASSSQSRKLYAARKRDAEDIKSKITANLEEAKNAFGIIAALDPAKPDFDAIEKLQDIDFVPSAALFTGESILIGGENVSNLTIFQSKAAVLKEYIKEHHRMTLERDRKELVDLVESNEALQEHKSFAVVFVPGSIIDLANENRDDLSKDKGFRPPRGTIVALPPGADANDEGEVTYIDLNTKKEATWPVRGLLPISIDQIVKTGDQNALQRYAQRVKALKFYALEMSKASAGILEGLDRVIDADSEASSTAGEAPADAAPTQ
ncbi:MAG: hypothetical protein AAGI01_09780 [Myxococcota bacterium]